MIEYPEFVSIGHVTYDIYPEKKLIGGSVIYSSLTAHNLGLSTGIITSRGIDFSCNGLLRGINIVSSLSDHTTTFRNSYHQGKRKQVVNQIANKIKIDQIPEQWNKAKIVHICPIANEVDEDIFDIFHDNLVGLTPQGLMRKWDKKGQVYPKYWIPNSKISSKVDVLILSEEDISDFPEVLEKYLSLIKIVIVTRGAKGSVLYWQGQKIIFPAFKAKEVDPTGAGDVFAAAFLIKYHQTGDPIESSRFANCVASFAVEEKGANSIPDLDRVIRRASLSGIYFSKIDN